MENPIKQVYQFNLQAGLLDNGYDDFLESSFQIEEALEGFDLFDLVNNIRSNYSGESTPKEYSRLIVNSVSLPTTGQLQVPVAIPDVDRLDKACDAIVFALGSIFKLGLNPAQATRALNIVMRHNFKKLSMPKDEHGKLTKPADFVGPEAELQALLDER